MKHFEKETAAEGIHCADNPVDSLTTMFVDLVQNGRIQRGQCPAQRPVFLKPHGVAHGRFRVIEKFPDQFQVGLFAGNEYPLWARFSSDTVPAVPDFRTTLGIGLKLFETPTPKIFGSPDDATFDFIMQNMDVFFVDTARDMCEFIQAAVVTGTVEAYLEAHPRTREVLDAMAKPVGSVLASPYWGILPFSLGPDNYVKYKLEPTIEVAAPEDPPSDPTYLAADLKQRLGECEAVFRFCLQLRTDPDTMPLDAATVPWSEEDSPFVHVADVIFPQQDINARGQAEYGEHLSWNIWRVTEDHRPQGSIADARREVYAASAATRHHANGIPEGEPPLPKPALDLPTCTDDTIVTASIHPAIGVARVGDAENEFFIGPEVTNPPEKAGTTRTAEGALKRQAARFRIYGYNAAGEVVRELTSRNANISWTVHVANQKASWFRFITAMDIPETEDLTLVRRNADLRLAARDSLAIDPGPRSISGAGVSGSAYKFDSGKFGEVRVYLGELHTDEMGRLLFLGGHGKSASPSGAPPYNPEEPDTFNNADDWYDDISDGPVNAQVTVEGREIPVEGAWVITAPPNYAPTMIGWRTMHDLLADVYVASGWMPVPEKTSFTKDVLPLLKRLSNLQWVNKGFATIFGSVGPLNFSDPAFLERLGAAPDNGDIHGPIRQALFNAFRPHSPIVNEPRIWPWIYGDDFSSSIFAESPRTMLALTQLQELHLKRWVSGEFEADWDPEQKLHSDLSEVPLAERPHMLDKAALHFCLADAFHPGCELTWPMRHTTLYQKPFRIRQRENSAPQDSYGRSITQEQILAADGPLHAQSAGDLTRWMGLPWQGDTAFCRSGYEPDYDPFLPTFWPARVPNWVLTEDDYQIVMDETRPRNERLEAYHRRAYWFRFIDDNAPTVAARMERMVAEFGSQGIVEARPGFENDPDFPEIIYVENIPQAFTADFRNAAAGLAIAMEKAPTGSREERLAQSGWGDEEHLQAAINLRARRRP